MTATEFLTLKGLIDFLEGLKVQMEIYQSDIDIDIKKFSEMNTTHDRHFVLLVCGTHSHVFELDTDQNLIDLYRKNFDYKSEFLITYHFNPFKEGFRNYTSSYFSVTKLNDKFHEMHFKDQIGHLKELFESDNLTLEDFEDLL